MLSLRGCVGEIDRWIVIAMPIVMCGCGSPLASSDGGALDGRAPPPDGGTFDAYVPPPDDGGASIDGGDVDGGDVDGSSPALDDGAMDGDVDAGIDGGFEPPSLDPSFGDGGVTLVNVADDGSGLLWSIVVQPDGKILAGGRTHDAHVIVRSLPDGTLDHGFGTGGVACAAVGAGGIEGNAPGGLAIAPDGSIVVSGYAAALNQIGRREVVARFTPAGQLDRTFAGSGISLSDFSVPEPVANAVLVQPDSRIVVAAGGHVDRLLPDGSLDPSFGTAGRFVATLGGGSMAYQTLALDDAGRIVVAGVESLPGGSRLVLVRLGSDGALDTSFGLGAGYVTEPVMDTPYGARTRASGLSFDASGRILMAGIQVTERSLARFSPGGVLDASFGDGGYAGGASLMALRSDGAIIAAGPATTEPTIPGNWVVRLTAGGAFDDTFGDAGLAVFDPNDIPCGLALGFEDAIYVTGTSPSLHDTYLQRMSASGALDTSFAGDGRLEMPTSTTSDRAFAVAVQPDGKILLGGASRFEGATLVRLLSDGSVDPTFDALTRVGYLEATESIAVDASGRILVAGPASAARVVRLLPDGSVDSSFELTGSSAPQTTHVTVGPDGAVYVAAFEVDYFGEYLTVTRLLEDGSADPAYGTAGETRVSTPDRGHALIAVQPDGRLVVNGGVLIRLDGSGALDPTFGAGGRIYDAGDAMALVVAPDGGIVRAMMRAAAGSSTDLVIERRWEDGRLDSTFGSDGAVVIPLGAIRRYESGNVVPVGLSVDGDGNILVATATSADGYVQHATLIHLAPNGSLDTRFGAGGREVLTLGQGSSALHTIATAADGTTLLVGEAIGPAGASDIMALRLR